MSCVIVNVTSENNGSATENEKLALQLTFKRLRPKMENVVHFNDVMFESCLTDFVLSCYCKSQTVSLTLVASDNVHRSRR